MNENLFKYELKEYHIRFYKNHSELHENQNNAKLEDDYFLITGNNRELIYTDGKKRKSPVFFTFSHEDYNEESFEKNYGNPLCAVLRKKLTLVVEKNGDKVSFKKFFTTLHRKVGKPYFQMSSRVDYISFNTKTKFIYKGYIIDYHKKKKCTKSVRKNFFSNNIINNFLLEIKSSLNNFKKSNNSVIFDMSSIFTKTCCVKEDLLLSLDDCFYREYLIKMGIKFPNNFDAFRKSAYEIQPKLKELKKSKLKMVDAFMIKNNLSGKILKKALHEVQKINLHVYKTTLANFGPDILNNDYDFIIGCLEYPEDLHYVYNNHPSHITEIFKGSEFKNVLKIYKDIIINKTINFSSFWDHVRYYSKLKNYGEQIKWTLDTISNKFHQEHLDWSEKVSQYEIGVYERIYPETFDTVCCKELINNDQSYFPVLLKKSSEYNEESTTQSNCVRNYISYPNAIIFSLRKDNPFSKERTTIEYRLFKNEENGFITAKNVQSRIRYNANPTTELNEVISKLDCIVQDYVSSKNYADVKLKKICNNGIILETEAVWKDDFLKWNKEDITSYNYYI